MLARKTREERREVVTLLRGNVIGWMSYCVGQIPGVRVTEEIQC